MTVESPLGALAAVVSDWRARYGRAVPEAAEMLAALELRGFTIVDREHAGCRAAVEHVADNHHGPDYPKCAAAWARRALDLP